MKHYLRIVPAFFALLCLFAIGRADAAVTVVFEERDFPSADTAPLSHILLHQAFPAAKYAAAEQLANALANPQADVLVVPYGSAFPRDQWVDIQRFLARGGNLVTLGGRPFTRPVEHIGKHWRLLPETYAFVRQLSISDYQSTSGSNGAASVVAADDAPAGLAALRWQRAYSVVIRLGQKETSPRVGTSGTYDAALTPLVSGVFAGHRLAAPVIEIDHFQNAYSGGRWVMANCSFEPSFLASAEAAPLLANLVKRATQGAELARALPSYPLYLPGEDWQIKVEWTSVQQQRKLARIDVSVSLDGRQEAVRSVHLAIPAAHADETVSMPTSGKPGFHTVEIKLTCADGPCGTLHTAFWIRDRAYLKAGPKLDVAGETFRIDRKPVAVVGTTYMASDAQRLYFRYPNPYVWDRDMAQIAAADMNMLRTGIWTDWDYVADDRGIAKERALRTIEAYLMTARRYGLPVQFTLFAFMPDVFGGINPYLDPIAQERARNFAASLAHAFADVPFLAWDLINEPSFDNPQHFFTTKANGDVAEAKAWNVWLLQRYKTRHAIEAAWHTVLADGPIAVPSDDDGTAQSANDGKTPAAVHDFILFTQESFTQWAAAMRGAIRNSGSSQLITVGQDEGGSLISPSPSYFASAVDFTTMHSWWFNDDLLWDSLSAKQKGLPMLVQETGVMTETNLDGRPRRTLAEDAELLERKIGIALNTGAGAIEWLWNVNAVMRSQQEVTIGAVRPDGTEKPEAGVLAAYAAFAKILSAHVSDAEPEPVVVLTSQAAQFSVLQAAATDAQQRAVRVLNYQCRMPARLVAENHVADIAGAKLVVLPSAQMLNDETWQSLLAYVRGGGSLLLTGSVERDASWRLRNRLRDIGIDGEPAALVSRNIPIRLGPKTVQATFANKTQRASEMIRSRDGRTYIESAYGKGRLFVVTAPVELGGAPETTAEVYRYVLDRLSLVPPFTGAPADSAVLIRPQVFKDAVLYVLASETADDVSLDLHDGISGGQIVEKLPAMRTLMVLLDRATGKRLATYRGPVLPND